MDMPLYPIGIQSFASLREGGFIYVDKTALIYQLVKRGKYYFLSRPRRFGKSLLISTLEAYFRGQKELFEGLAIAELEKEWAECPVFRLDLSPAEYTVERELTELLNNSLFVIFRMMGVDSFVSGPFVCSVKGGVEVETLKPNVGRARKGVAVVYASRGLWHGVKARLCPL